MSEWVKNTIDWLKDCGFVVIGVHSVPAILEAIEFIKNNSDVIVIISRRCKNRETIEIIDQLYMIDPDARVIC